MKRLIGFLVILALMLTACALGEEEPVALTYNRSELYLREGQTFELEVATAPKGGIRWGGFTYESSDKEIATVNRDGVVKGVKVGECEVTATSKKDPSVTAVIPVHVVVAVSKINITMEKKNLHVGEELPVTVSFEPSDASYPEATFSSSDEKIATVSDKGVITGVKKGSFTLTVRSRDGKKSERVDMRVTQQPTGVELKCKNQSMIVGQSQRVNAAVLPENASNKSLTWSSSDESVATVNKEGVVKGIGMGNVTITATCQDDTSVSASIDLRLVQRANRVEYTMGGEPRMHVGNTAQLSWTVSPESTTDKSVTFKSNDTRIATVDENGLVTGIKAGKTTITVKTTDGSEKTARVVVHVDQPVTGVSLDLEEIRIAVGYHGKVKAILEPKGATNKAMTWVSSDESIATVSGKDINVSIKGRQWGECTVTGTTEDGGYSATIQVHVGSYRFAIKVVSVKIKNGKPSLVLKNVSNLDIAQVRYRMRGFDGDMNPIDMTTRGDDLTILKGTYEHPLAPGESTRHGSFSFRHPSPYIDMQTLQFCITGITTADGFVYNVRERQWNWVSYTNEIPTN